MSGPHQVGTKLAVGWQLELFGLRGIGLDAIPSLPSTAASLSRLSVPTSRLRRCDIGLAAGWSAGLLRSGDGPTDTTPGSPCGLGSLWSRLGCGCLSLCSCVFSLPFVVFRGGTWSRCTTNTTCSRPVRHMVMRARLIPYDRRGLLSVPCSLGCMTTRGLYRPVRQKR